MSVLLKLEQHPDKTFMGKLSGGFEALGFRFRQGVGLCGPSTQAIQRLAGRLTERYAQHRGRESLRQYVHRWISSHFGPHTAVRGPAKKQTSITHTPYETYEVTKPPPRLTLETHNPGVHRLNRSRL